MGDFSDLRRAEIRLAAEREEVSKHSRSNRQLFIISAHTFPSSIPRQCDRLISQINALKDESERGGSGGLALSSAPTPPPAAFSQTFLAGLAAAAASAAAAAARARASC